MTPLLFFLLACATVYVGVVQVAFSALMRLPLRLSAERSERKGRADGLGHYLDDPIRLFLPARLLQGLSLAAATILASTWTTTPSAGALALVFGGMVLFLLVCAHLVPLLIASRDPERILEALLPPFDVTARILSPLTGRLIRVLNGTGRDRSRERSKDPSLDGADEDDGMDQGAAARSEREEHEERKLLQSVVEFGGTLVREVMTPRPDIVAVKSTVTLEELRAFVVDQQYSRIPVYKDSLDEILGFVFVKDLVSLTPRGTSTLGPATLPGGASDSGVVSRLLRPAYVVPETKRVAELLKEFQREQVQSAIVHDEYGGTAGLVTIEDLLEEIVGEIRDEYDDESEPIVDEGDGQYVFAGTVGVDDVAERLDIEIERHGFETVGGYLLARLGRVPRVGETFDVDDVDVEILEGERRRVQRVRMRRRPIPSKGKAVADA